MFQLGVHAIISIIIYLIAIGLAFQAMKAVQLEKIVRKGRIVETQRLYLHGAIALGFLGDNFGITVIDTSMQHSNLF